MFALLRVAECLSTHTLVVQVLAVYMVEREGTKTLRKIYLVLFFFTKTFYCLALEQVYSFIITNFP